MVIPCPTDDDRAQLMMEMLFLQLLLGMILSECYALKTDMLGGDDRSNNDYAGNAPGNARDWAYFLLPPSNCAGNAAWAGNSCGDPGNYDYASSSAAGDAGRVELPGMGGNR